MPNKYSYSKHEGELLVIEKGDGKVFWKGKPKQLDVEEILPIQGTDDCIILLDVDQAECRSTRNLLRCGPDGNIQWESGFPSMIILGIKRTDHEIYISVKKVDELVVKANSLSGFLDYIEVRTGNIIKSVFVK